MVSYLAVGSLVTRLVPLSLPLFPNCAERLDNCLGEHRGCHPDPSEPGGSYVVRRIAVADVGPVPDATRAATTSARMAVARTAFEMLVKRPIPLEFT